MAFNPDGLLELARQCRRFNLGGRCLTLGRQDVNVTLEAAASLLVRTGHLQIEPSGGLRMPVMLAIMMQTGRHLSPKPQLRAMSFISDKALFAALGFTAMESVDVSAYEGADFVYDMNLPGMGARLGSTYDFVLDASTTEHVYDFPTALENIHDVLAVGGVLIQSMALGNRLDHGFYQATPELLLDYYETNGYEILACEITRLLITPTIAQQPFMGGILMRPALAYARGVLDDRNDGGMDAGAYKVCIAARKTERSTKGRFPTPPSLAWTAKPGRFPIDALRRLEAARRSFGLGGACLTLGANPGFADRRALGQAGDGALSDREALQALGFARVTVLDSAAGPGVDLVADLNRLEPAPSAGGPFDFVLDWGASSRVFRLAQLFQNLLAAVRIGGVIWHIVPSQNLLGRGCYMICPTLLHDFYTTNRWEILEFEIAHVRAWHDPAWFATPYDPGSIDFMSFGGAPEGAFLSAVMVRRTADSTADRIPQQSWFSRHTTFDAGLAPEQSASA